MRAGLLALTVALAGCAGEPKPTAVTLPPHAFELPACAPATAPPVEPTTTSIGVLLDHRVPRDAAMLRVSGAVSWWARHGVVFEVVDEGSAPIPIALEHPEVSPPPIVFGERLTPPRHQLGFNPHALAVAPGTELADQLGRRRAAVLAGWTELSRLHPDDATLTLAHELGHLLGLEHTEEPGHLMTPGRFRCVPTAP